MGAGRGKGKVACDEDGSDEVMQLDGEEEFEGVAEEEIPEVDEAESGSDAGFDWAQYEQELERADDMDGDEEEDNAEGNQDGGGMKETLDDSVASASTSRLTQIC